MSSKGVVFINGRIDQEMYRRVIKELQEAERATKKNEIVTVYFDSQGGDSQTACGLYDIVRSCKRKVTGIVAGRADSGAPVILQACHRRLMTEHSSIMLHRLSLCIGELSLGDAKTTVQRFEQLDEKMIDIISAKARYSRDEVAKLMSVDVHLDASKALEFGLIDQVI